MEIEKNKRVEVTPEQLAIADEWIVDCNLQDVADVELEVLGETGSVRYGLARCIDHMIDMKPEQIHKWVHTKIEQQAENPSV
jgi:hypothetical protein